MFHVRGDVRHEGLRIGEDLQFNIQYVNEVLTMRASLTSLY